MKPRSLLIIALILVPACSSFQMSTRDYAMTQVANPDYMNGCGELGSLAVGNQQGYLNIFPGKSNKLEVEGILGKPERISSFSDYEEWRYDEVNVRFTSGELSSIFVHSLGKRATLSELVNLHGCPDIIFAMDVSEHPEGNYFVLSFVYHNIGVSFFYNSLFVTLDSKYVESIYFKPSSLEEFIIEREGSYSYPNRAKPITWEEAVR